MSRSILFGPACAAVAMLVFGAASAAEIDPCTTFTWDVSHELAVMKQSPLAVSAAKTPLAVPQFELDKLYELRLAAQSTVTFQAKPAKPALDDGSQAGLVRFRTAQAGRYRVSITSGHWIDVVDGAQPVKSRDFQGQRGCARPHKIVEFELAADRDYILQFSGSTDAQVVVAITPVAAPSAG